MVDAYIVEDHEDMRLILKRFLTRKLEGVRVVGECHSAEEALVEIPRLRPRIVLVDISLPGMDGLELIRRLRFHSHAFWILVVTGHEVELYRHKALEAGANEIVSKEDLGRMVTILRTHLAHLSA
jgi:DNA-binding NarL/FixJ family response regulator